MVCEEYKSYYDFIIGVIHEAGQILNDGFNNTKKKVLSKEREGVTILNETERRIEELLTENIRNRFSAHRIITGKSSETLTDAHTWIINSVDGKQNFLKGTPIVAISVALAVGKNAVIGIVFNPIINELYSTIRSGGAYCNGQKITSSKNEDLGNSVVGTEFPLPTAPFHRERTLEKMCLLSQNGVLGFRCFGSTALSLCYIANGSLNVFCNEAFHCSEVAAGLLILEEAGGFVNWEHGSNIELPSKILFSAGSKTLLKEVMEILKSFL